MRVGFLQIWRARHFRPIAVAVLLVGGMAVGLPTASASDPCADPAGVIACENSKPGTPASVWDVSGAGDSDIQGFATDISVNIGQQINFKIDTTASAYTIDIYRLGYYGGAGGGNGSGNDGPGGGGSSYISGLVQHLPIRNEQGATNSQNAYSPPAQLPGGTDGPDYQAGIGVGGATVTSGTVGNNGGNGQIVIYW